MFRRSLLVVLLALTVTSCVPPRAQRDRKLAKACEAAVKSVADKGEDIVFNTRTFNTVQSSQGVNLRQVTLHAEMSYDNGAYQEKTYTCWFDEDTNIIFGWQPKLDHMDRDGVKYGNINGQIEGDYDDMLKINQAVQGVLN